jgi:hypothetical protein
MNYEGSRSLCNHPRMRYASGAWRRRCCWCHAHERSTEQDSDGMNRIVANTEQVSGERQKTQVVTASIGNRHRKGLPSDLVGHGTRLPSAQPLTRSQHCSLQYCAIPASGMTTCNREPSGSDASTNGELRSTRRPDDWSIRSTRSRTSLSVRTSGVSSEMP